MAKTKDIYRCTECGSVSPRWQGQCPGCKEWNTLELEVVDSKRAKAVGTAKTRANEPILLEDVSVEGLEARTTGIPALDTVLGRGLVPGSAVLLGGEPGIGKSTLLLQLAGAQAASGQKALYVSGEEALHQIRGRAERLGLLGRGLNAIATNSVEDVLAALESGNAPDVVIADSVQTLASAAADGIPGSVSQVRAVAAELVEKCKKTNTTLILVGHVTKDGQIAGPRLLEHMVDTVLYLEGDRRRFSRVLRVLKNRFGPCDELLVLTMGERGLNVVDDPSTFFLGARDAGHSGTALGLAVEGRRPFAVEIQALATKTFLAQPRRNTLGLDKNRVNLILAVIEKRLRINLAQYDIYAKIGGGLSPRDPGLDLAVAAAVLSSFYDVPLPAESIFWGEVDLSGAVRPAPARETRMKQAARLGFNPILHSGNCSSLADLQRHLFGRG